MTIKLADRLVEYRKKAGFSQEQLAEKLGVSRQAISKWERAEASPDTDNLLELAKLYDVSLDELVDHNPKNAYSISNENSNNEGDLKEEKKTSFIAGTITSVFIFLCAIAYVVFGYWYTSPLGSTGISSWAGLWPIFILIPVPETIYTAIRHKKISDFCFPCLIASIYCFLGMLFNLWHPMWVLFILIPAFYVIFEPIDRHNHGKEVYEDIEDDNKTEEDHSDKE